MFYPDLWIRLPLYVSLGLITEVLFTGIVDLINPHFLQSWNAKVLDKRRPDIVQRDPRAMGYTFLWMIPVYLLMSFFEPLSQILINTPWLLRGLIYTSLLWVVEYITGALIKKMTGYNPWDYSYTPLSLHGHIRWDFGLFWFIFTLFAEFMSHKFVLLTPAIKAAFGII